jgi:hypothetical protein
MPSISEPLLNRRFGLLRASGAAEQDSWHNVPLRPLAPAQASGAKLARWLERTTLCAKLDMRLA